MRLIAAPPETIEASIHPSTYTEYNHRSPSTIEFLMKLRFSAMYHSLQVFYDIDNDNNFI